ncbi:MAG: hypothetical protein KatS3mg009_1088 [Acidimicrobiia bacterium]|nr:MAG: hypothetical protein KatS3mg009_1088 [Acidimicrobiia bacterium]
MIAHRDADVGLLQRGASLTPSPVIATTSPRRLQRPHDPQLVLGRDPGEHADGVDFRSRARRRTCRASLDARRRSRPSMPSSRAIAVAVRAWSPVIIFTAIPARRHAPIAARASGPRRVGDPDEALEGEVRDQSGERVDVPGERAGRERAGRHGQHAQPPCRELVARRGTGPVGVAAACGHQFGGALHRDEDGVAEVDERRHPLAVGVERHLGDAREPPAERFGVQPGGDGRLDERDLGRVARRLAVARRGGVAAQDCGPQELRVGTCGPQLAHHHPVERQGARSCRCRSPSSRRASRPRPGASRSRAASRAGGSPRRASRSGLRGAPPGSPRRRARPR